MSWYVNEYTTVSGISRNSSNAIYCHHYSFQNSPHTVQSHCKFRDKEPTADTNTLYTYTDIINQKTASPP